MAYAQTDENTIDLTNFPEYLGNALNVSTFAGGIIATLILCLMFLLPVAIYTKTVIPPIIIGVLSLCFGVAVGWIHYWFLLINCLFIALLFSGAVRGWITSGK